MHPLAFLRFILREGIWALRGPRAAFSSPPALCQFSMATVADLRAAGFDAAAATLEAATAYVTNSGWEWLGELGLATASILNQFQLPEPIAASVRRIHNAATSRHPYG